MTFLFCQVLFVYPILHENCNSNMQYNSSIMKMSLISELKDRFSDFQPALYHYDVSSICKLTSLLPIT